MIVCLLVYGYLGTTKAIEVILTYTVCLFMAIHRFFK